MPVAVIEDRLPRHLTTPIASALKKLLYLSLLEALTGILKRLLDPGGRFVSETSVS
jgi:hypothetical protein